MEIKKGRWIMKGIMMWKSKGTCKREQYDSQIKRQVDKKKGITMCKLKGQMDKGHYDVQIMIWMQKMAL